MKWQLAVALLGFAVAPFAVAQTSSIYSARLASSQSAEEQYVGSTKWICKDLLCRTERAVRYNAADAMRACKAIFAWKGAIAEFGGSARFTPAQLTECNTPPPPPVRAIQRPPGAPPLTQPKITTQPKTPG
jgi:hypothetical protein